VLPSRHPNARIGGVCRLSEANPDAGLVGRLPAIARRKAGTKILIPVFRRNETIHLREIVRLSTINP
jgi:hypothetical protein